MRQISTSVPERNRVAQFRAWAALCVVTIAFGWSVLLPVDDRQRPRQSKRTEIMEVSLKRDAKDQAATREAVLKSLERQDWTAVLDQSAKLIPKPPADQERLHQDFFRQDLRIDESWKEEIQELESTRQLLEQIRKSAPEGDKTVADRLTDLFIQLDQALARRLDPPRTHKLWGWDSALTEIEWWWEGVPEAREYIESDERYSKWHWRVHQALGRDGKPIYLDPPANYAPDLPRSKKLLFVLDEIERLDKSDRRNAAAEALLAKARVMRRLYGPQTDVDWRSIEFYYRYDKRPSFKSSSAPAGTKETWELADDEARTNVGEKSRVIELPKSQSPLALLSRLEQDYPNSTSVAASLYERGLYYQSRRQFAQAIDAYRKQIRQFPEHELAENAKSQMARIEHADVLLGKTGTYAAGLPPKIWFACRNASEIEFTARKFDLKAWLKESDDESLRLLQYGYFMFGHFGHDERELTKVVKFAGAQVADWRQAVERRDRIASHSTSAPLTEPGAYLVDAKVPGSDQKATALVIVSGIAILQKPLTDKVVLWIVDPRSGQAIPNQKVRIVTWTYGNRREKKAESEQTSNAMGLIEYVGDGDAGHSEHALFAESPERGAMFCTVADRAYDQTEHQSAISTALTDRPVYRPGSTINFRIWIREMRNRTYLPAEAGRKTDVAVQGSNGLTIRTLSLETDHEGSVTGSFSLGAETPLGEYYLQTRTAERHHPGIATTFRVEEYKAPEYSVTVLPSKIISRPNEPISARVAAEYYFGAPVARADVSYKIFRQRQELSPAFADPFDWLYGRGYKNSRAVHQNEDDDEDWETRIWSRGRRGNGELVAEGSLKLDSDGKAEILFPADKLATDSKEAWRYDIQVEVRDQSRRTVEATGSVIAAPREFYAFARVSRGWCAPGDSIVVDIRARSVNDTPVSATGQATLKRLEIAPGESASKAMPIQHWDVALDAEGNHALKINAPEPGRYEMEFKTRDQQGAEISTSTEFWVYQPNGELTHSPLPELQIVSDHPTYRIGETARLLVVTAAPDANVMLSESWRDFRFLRVSNHAQILEIPITDKSGLDLWVQGTAIWQGAAHSSQCRLYVPPIRDLLNVELVSDKKVHKPGERGTLRIKVTDYEGRPVSGDLALTAFDKSVTYIHSQSEIGPKSFLVKQVLSAGRWASDFLFSLTPRPFNTAGTFMCPEFYLTDDFVPQIGGMGGAAPTGGDPSDADGKADGTESSRQGGYGQIAPPRLRSDFSDTALWRPHLAVDTNGMAETEILFPDSLTTWRLRGFLVTKNTRIGDLSQDLVTSKDLLVRLQRPRFVVERDQVVLSASVYNKLPDDKSVTAELQVPAAIFRSADGAKPDQTGNLCLKAQAKIPSGGQHRFDWTLSVISDGLATVTVKAVTDVDSDAMQTSIPVRTREVIETVTQTGAFISGDKGTKTLKFDVPDDASPRKTRLVLTLATTPASAAFEAIPYLAAYPYGCVEQTMSRFYPTVLAAKTLRQLGIDVAKLSERSQAKTGHWTPMSATYLDQSRLEQMTEAGLRRLEQFQHDDGGWGWWKNDQSSRYMTAYVLLGLHVATECGAKVDEHGFNSGLNFLAKEDQGKSAPDWRISAGANHTEMMAAYALSLSRPPGFRAQDGSERKMIDKALEQRLSAALADRGQRPLYDRLLLALSLHNHQENDKASTVLQEILQSISEDEKQGTAHLPVASPDYWHAWNSEIETNAWLIRAIVAIDRENPLAAKVVNWLALNRKHGRFWRSTRDTALAITGIAEYMSALNTKDADTQVVYRIDDGPPVPIQLLHSDLLGLDVVIEQQISSGQHELKVERQGTSPLNFALHSEFHRKTAQAVAQGNGLAIGRKYFRLEPRKPESNQASDGSATEKTNRILAGEFARRPLESDAAIAVGDVMEVELAIDADENYEYVAFEDMKPAGCEPVQVRSGYEYGDGLCANVELRDERVVFFASRLTKGRHILRYKLRAETPGQFHALPARGFAMYAPEIHANSDEFRLKIRDRD